MPTIRRPTIAHKSRIHRELVALLGLVALSSTLLLAAPPASQPATVLLHLPGIAGEMPIDHNLVNGLKDAGLTADARILDWTGNDRGVPALTNVDRHREKSARLAAYITDLSKKSPGVPIVLTAHSAGTGIAVQALEQLPEGVNVQTLVLLASALSPDYDLSRALSHVTGPAYSLSSEYDNLVLSVGTRTFGTYDRVWTDAAGFCGFRQPPTADKAAYAKLTEVRYDPAWAKIGNGGDHIGPTNRRFAKEVLARVIRTGTIPTTQPQP